MHGVQKTREVAIEPLDSTHVHHVEKRHGAYGHPAMRPGARCSAYIYFISIPNSTDLSVTLSSVVEQPDLKYMILSGREVARGQRSSWRNRFLYG